MEVAYLGHVVTQTGVMVDQDKIREVSGWPIPTTVRALRGFLGLAGYYRKFVKDFGITAAPLTRLLRKNSFVWDMEATQAFEKLKSALTSTPVLALPNFTEVFIVDCDASESGLGAVLHQKGRPIAFFSQSLPNRYCKLPAYEKELIGLVKAIRHWRAYFWGNPFVVRTDHYSLKFLLEQRITTSPQQHWISKLLGFDFKVEYKSGKMNIVADALSRQNEDNPLTISAISIPQLTWESEIKEAIRADPKLQDLITKIQEGEALGPWEYTGELLLYKKKLFVTTNHEPYSNYSCLYP